MGQIDCTGMNFSANLYTPSASLTHNTHNILHWYSFVYIYRYSFILFFSFTFSPVACQFRLMMRIANSIDIMMNIYWDITKPYRKTSTSREKNGTVTFTSLFVVRILIQWLGSFFLFFFFKYEHRIFRGFSVWNYVGLLIKWFWE